MRLLCTVYMFCSVLLCSVTQADIVIDGYTAATNDRFTNSSSFIGAGFNLSGVGQTDTNRWGTLISPNVVISANHFAAVGNISFYPSNDPNSIAVTRQITNSQRIGNSDIYLSRLSSPVDSSIQFYNYATEPISGPPQQPMTNIQFVDAGIYQDMNGYVVGRSPANQPIIQDQAIGRNIISAYAEDIDFLDGVTDTLVLLREQPTDGDYVQYEALVQSGDSGAPFFVDINGSLRLLGINSFQLLNDQNIPVASGINYTGNEATQIGLFIAANAVAVPEPAAFILLALSLGLLCLSRSQKRLPTWFLAASARFSVY